MENVKKYKGGNKVESVSAEDLKKIIKEMIKKALNDNDHMVKLHRKVCEEWSSLLHEKSPENRVKISPKKNKSPMTIKIERPKIEKVELNKKNPNFNYSKKKIQRDQENFSKLQKPEVNLQKKIKDEENARWRRERAWEFYHQQKKVHKGWKMRKNLELNFWFNQLDSVLHQKYMREHRHRVQSFYCQPTYYGTDIPDALYQQYMQYGFIN